MSFLFVTLLVPLGAQERFYYGTNSKMLDNEDCAVLLKELVRKGESRYTLTTRYRSGGDWVFLRRDRFRMKDDVMLIRSKGDGFFNTRIHRRFSSTRNGLHAFSDSGSAGLIREGSSSRLIPLHLEDTVKTWYDNGQLQSLSFYRDNQLQWNRNWLRDGSPYIDTIFYSADEEPEYQYGDKFFNNYILKSLEKSGYDFSQINDEVEIGWVIMEDGSLQGIRSVQGKIPKLNRYIMETIAGMPGNWKPATLEGKPVRYFMSIPFNFQSREATFQSVDFSSGMLHYDRY